MWGFLTPLLAGMFGTSVARALTGAGLAVISFTSLTPIFNSMLATLADNFGSLPGAMAQLLLMSGFGVALSAIGSAMLTRVAIFSARIAIGKAA